MRVIVLPARFSLIGVFSLLGLAPLVGCTGEGDLPGEGDSAEDSNADPKVHTYIPDGYRASDPKRVIFLGDSITERYGASEDALAYTSLLVENDAQTWPDQDGQDLATAYPELTEVVDVSRGGATTETLLDSQIGKLDDQMSFPAEGESLVVMTIGGNDITGLMLSGSTDYSEPLQAIQDNLRAIVESFQDPDRFPDGAFLYVTNVYDPSDGTGQADECFYGLDMGHLMEPMAQTNADSAAMAAELGFSLVDLHGHFLGHGFNGDEPTNENYAGDDYEQWFYRDCIHPNDVGHNQIRRLFLAAIQGEALQLE